MQSATIKMPVNKKAAISRAQLMQKLAEIVHANTVDPVDELRATGKVFLEIADALEGLSASEAIAVFWAVRELM